MNKIINKEKCEVLSPRLVIKIQKFLKSLKILLTLRREDARYGLFQTYMSEARELGSDAAHARADAEESKQEQTLLETGALEMENSMVKN